MAEEHLELVTIGGQTFSLPFSPADSKRRKKYFDEKIYLTEPNVLLIQDSGSSKINVKFDSENGNSSKTGAKMGGYYDDLNDVSLDSHKIPQENDMWLESNIQEGGAETNLSIYINILGSLQKEAQLIFDSIKPNSADSSHGFLISLMDMQIKNAFAIGDLDTKLKEVGNFIHKDIDRQTFSPQEYTTTEYNTKTFVSIRLEQKTNFLNDIVRKTIVLLLGVADDYLDSKFFANEKDFRYERKGDSFVFYKKEETLSTDLFSLKSSNSSVFPIEYVFLTLGRTKNTDEPLSEILKKITESTKTKLDFLKPLSEGGKEFKLLNGEVMIQLGGDEKFKKSIGDITGSFANTLSRTSTIDTRNTSTITPTASTSQDTDTSSSELAIPTLKEDEKTILKALGFDYELLCQLGPYLPTFFDSLPSCSTDTAMMLKHECETAYFVLWSVMFKAQDALRNRIKAEPNDKFMHDIESGLARQTTHGLFELHKKPHVAFSEKDVLRLFTIVRKRKHMFSPEDEKHIQRIFTIIKRRSKGSAATIPLAKPLTKEEEVAISRLFNF